MDGGYEASRPQVAKGLGTRVFGFILNPVARGSLRGDHGTQTPGCGQRTQQRLGCLWSASMAVCGTAPWEETREGCGALQ